MRLGDERSTIKIKVIRKFLMSYGEKLIDRFVVATEDQVRFGSDDISEIHRME